jgi:predicted nucleic acid-binding protein
MPIVVDASVILAWLFEDEASDYAERTLEALREDEGVAPSLWAFEVANSLLMAERRGRSTARGTERSIELVSALPITIHDIMTQNVFGPVLALARKEQLTVYDASYLELAMRQDLALATQDRELRKAADRVGVALF